MKARSVSQVDWLRGLLARLDVPAAEVMVKAVVYEVRKDEHSGSAVSLALGLLNSVRGLGRLADERLRMVEAGWDTEVVRLYIRLMANPRDEARSKRFLSEFQRWHDAKGGCPHCKVLFEANKKLS